MPVKGKGYGKGKANGGMGKIKPGKSAGTAFGGGKVTNGGTGRASSNPKANRGTAGTMGSLTKKGR